SYRDLAQEIGIRSASIHHHFPTKADLGKAMIRRYRERFAERLQEIDGGGSSPLEKLRAFVGLYGQTARSECGVCLGGVLAAELLTLAPEVQAELKEFFTQAEHWLAEVLAAGAATGEITLQGPARGAAVAFVATLQGAMMVARAHGDVESFDAASGWLLASLSGS